MAGAIVRPAAAADVGAIHAIYAHHVAHGFGTFEEVAPDVADMARRFQDVVGPGFPYLVAERAGNVIGYAYAAPFRARSAYRYALEDSIYVSPDATGQGVGRLLLGQLIKVCEAADFRQIVAVIGDSANLPSIALHKSLGFSDAGVLSDIAYKRRRWVDAVILRRQLGPGGAAPPSRP
jgi:L-amino acid N-acyltransferase YncA